ncbi:MAG: hypothetical protein ACJ72D_09060 [Marmoricola sp.]
MNTIVIAPEVLTFVAVVRVQLADLGPEELLEITDGLEADLTELVTEQGLDALGDPVVYARELRTAAGLTETTTNRRPRPSVAAGLHGLLDGVRAVWDRVLVQLPGDLAGFLVAVRPFWWVARAWVAVELVAMLAGDSYPTLVPGSSALGALTVAVAAVASVQLGRAKVWPGERIRTVAVLRLALVALNVVCIAMAPYLVDKLQETGRVNHGDAYTAGYSRGIDQGYADGSAGTGDKAGLYADGHWVSNIYPYDAAGRPLVGVQLYDQTGKPVDVVSANECVYDSGEQPTDAVRQYFSWSDGAAQKHNVFPVPSKVSSGSTSDADAQAFAGKDRPTVSGFPYARIPEVSLPGLLTSSATTPAKAFVPGPRTGPINPVDNGC